MALCALGRAPIEAMANGIPALAGDRGALPQTLGDAGFVFAIPDRCTPASSVVPTAQAVAPWMAVIERRWDDSAFMASSVSPPGVPAGRAEDTQGVAVGWIVAGPSGRRTHLARVYLGFRSESLSFRQPGHRRIGGDPDRAELETCSPAIQIGLLGRAIKGPQGVAFHKKQRIRAKQDPLRATGLGTLDWTFPKSQNWEKKKTITYYI